MKSRLLASVFNTGDREQMLLFRTLAALLESRVPLAEALDECIRTGVAGNAPAWLIRVRDRVCAGESLSGALTKEHAVAPVAGALVQTAESTGAMAPALHQVADILEMRRENSQTLASALTYPAIIMVITFFAAIFMATAILPRLESMYHQAGRELPVITRIITSGTFFLGLIAIVTVLTGMIAAGVRRLRYDKPDSPRRQSPDSGSEPISSNSRVTIALWGLLERIPLVRTVNQVHATALWTHCLGILLRSDIPLPDALALTAETALYPVTAQELTRVRSQIVAGDNPTAAFAQMTSTPALALRLLAGGDAAGDLVEACSRVQHLYEMEYRSAIRRLLVLAEPVAVVIAGGLVILVALSVLLPIADLGGLL